MLLNFNLKELKPVIKGYVVGESSDDDILCSKEITEDFVVVAKTADGNGYLTKIDVVDADANQIKLEDFPDIGITAANIGLQVCVAGPKGYQYKPAWRAIRKTLGAQGVKEITERKYEQNNSKKDIYVPLNSMVFFIVYDGEGKEE
ncbi:hypothetical protein HOK51_09330 [Candidatus Woesearchaeota archaeon]|jgi:hypothetical protein|nr:hypothetical protein [Candidatus Woesearchaeota archaeon]MBT6520030.1 hypothetical protein [Candidatus Woesearchaeota archaeon]MBT7368613.1 hypothetical protein [Candidatus Woesearchaeota archaeon]